MTTDTQPLLGQVLDTDGIRAICLLDREVLIALRSRSFAGTSAASSVGGLCKILVGETFLIGTLNDLEVDRQDAAKVIAAIEYIGEGPRGADNVLASFRRGVSHYPHPGDEVRLAAADDYRRIYAPPDLPHIMLGTVFPTDDVPAPILYDRLLGRHFAVVGSSGAGKSTTVSLLTHRIIEKVPHAHVVVLDPHGEYAHSFGDRARVWDTSNLRLPYWAMNLEEHCDAFITATGDEEAVDRNILAKCLHMARARNVRLSHAASITADSPVPYQLADLTGALDEEAGRLEKVADASRYTLLRLTLEQFFGDSRFNFIFNTRHYDLTLEGLLGDLLRIPDEGKPVSIIDLAGVPTEIVNVVVSTLARLMLDFAIRSPRERRVPLLLICEEAHRYLPRVPNAYTASVERQLERIAREGRKYGVCLGLVSQRPSELSETALSQCGTIFSMRLNNQDDQSRLRASISEGARNLVGVIAALQNRECIVSGDGVPVPMRLMVDTVDDAQKPASEDELFSVKWQTETAGRADLETIVARWREGEER